jgi:preprotein translocase subunit SecG
MQARALLNTADRRSMASKEDEQVNYWPGYVDALTTMTMVLTFVMMILALAVFLLSNNVSKAVLENVVREIDAEMPDNPTPVALKQAILDRISDSERDRTDLTSRSDDKPGQADPQHDSDAIAPTEIAAGKIDDVEEPDGKTRISTTPATLTIRYEGNEARLDEKTTEQVRAFLESSEDIQNATRLLVRAFASAEMGGITQSRRIAYYRAMLLRAELVNNGVPANRIQIDVVETRERAEAATAKVYTQGAPD